MIQCPNCKHEEVVGALFCSECGEQLVFTERLPTSTFAVIPGKPTNPPPTGPIEEGTAALQLVDTGQKLALAGRNEFTLGRVAEGQPILPDIDLSPYDAYSQGVSRLHAVIKTTPRASVMDLGSSNGTRVNGTKIPAHVEYPLNHGDLVALGKLKIQVLIRR